MVAIRIWPRDRWVWTALVYYTTPWFLLSGISLFAQLLRRSRAWFAFTLVLFGTGVFTLKGPGGVPVEEAVHLRLWNAQNPRTFQAEILSQMLKDGPDVVVATDSGPLAYWIRKTEALSESGYTAVVPGGGFLFLLKPPLRLENVQLLRFIHPHSRLAVGDLVLPDDRRLSLVAVELDYYPKRSKEPLFREFTAALEGLESPRLLAGDFNVPPGSVWLKALNTKQIRSAFRERGRGWEVSWPAPFSFLGIDQVWGDPGIEFHQAEYGPALHSDHRKLDVYWSLVGDPDDT